MNHTSYVLLQESDSMEIDDSLNNELKKILKPLKHIQIDFNNDNTVSLRLFYGNVKGTCVVTRYKLTKSNTMESIFDEIRPLIVREFLETNWGSK